MCRRAYALMPSRCRLERSWPALAIAPGTARGSVEPLRVSFEGQVRLHWSRCSRFTLYFTCVHLSARWDPKVVGAHHAPSHGDDGNERIAGSGPGRSPIEGGGQADDVSSVAKSNKLARTCPKRWLDGAATGAQRTQFQGARRRFTLTSSIFPSW